MRVDTVKKANNLLGQISFVKEELRKLDNKDIRIVIDHKEAGPNITADSSFILPVVKMSKVKFNKQLAELNQQFEELK